MSYAINHKQPIVITQVMAKDGDSLDSLCYEYLGNSDGLEQVIAMNPDYLIKHLSAGDVINLPNRLPAKKASKTISLWD